MKTVTFIGRGRLVLPPVAIGLALCLATEAALGSIRQEPPQQVTEIVADLASGQVTLIAAHDGLVVATIGTQLEPGGLPPLIVPMTGSELVVVLGAVDWVEPPSNRTVLRLDAQLPGLAHATTGNAPRLSNETGLSNPEEIGLAVLDPLRAAAENIHDQLDLPEGFPVAELVFAHQPPDNGQPDVWDLSYIMQQKFLQKDFWDTQVERPRAIELYPSDENKSGLMEIRYPPDDRSPGLLDWLQRPVGRLAQAVQLDPKMAKVQRQIAGGEAHKIHLADLAPLVKTAVEMMAPVSTGRAMAVISGDKGFSWVIQPPAAAQPQKRVARPPGAPTLQTHPHP